MNAPTRLVYVTDSEPAPRFSELADVKSTRPLERRDGSVIDAGSTGTVLLVLGAGAAYEVEFGEKPADLLTVHAEDLVPADGAE